MAALSLSLPAENYLEWNEWQSLKDSMKLVLLKKVALMNKEVVLMFQLYCLEVSMKFFQNSAFDLLLKLDLRGWKSSLRCSVHLKPDRSLLDQLTNSSISTI